MKLLSVIHFAHLSACVTPDDGCLTEMLPALLIMKGAEQCVGASS